MSAIMTVINLLQTPILILGLMQVQILMPARDAHTGSAAG